MILCIIWKCSENLHGLVAVPTDAFETTGNGPRFLCPHLGEQEAKVGTCQAELSSPDYMEPRKLFGTQTPFIIHFERATIR